MAQKSWIPEVPDDQILELSKRIKPVVDFPSIGKRYIKPVDLFEIAYLWNPQADGEATGLAALCDIVTYHSFTFHGYFKPSIAEVLAQIPREYVDRVVAFEIVEKPETAEDLNRYIRATTAGYHVAKTRLYVRA